MMLRALPLQIVLSASSPDDEALVLGAKYFGVEFTERIDTSAIIHRTPVRSVMYCRGGKGGVEGGQPLSDLWDVNFALFSGEG